MDTHIFAAQLKLALPIMLSRAGERGLLASDEFEAWYHRRGELAPA